MKHVILLLAILLFPSIGTATVLSDAAAKLAAGQWATLTESSGMIGLNNTAALGWQSGSNNRGPAFDGSQPAWNSGSRQLYIETSEHNDSNACPDQWPGLLNWCWKKLMTYDDATNTWSINGPFPNHNGNPVEGVHVWGGIAWDNINRVLYVKAHNNVQIYRYCASNSPASYCASQLNQWTELPAAPYLAQVGNFIGGYIVGQQLGWHPTLNGGTLLYYDGAQGGTPCGGLAGYTEGQGWRIVDPGTGCKYGQNGGTTLINAQLSTIKNLVIYGGTGPNVTQWWSINGSGTIAALDTAPCLFHSTVGGFSQAAEDPNTGNIYFIGCTTAGQLWRLNPTGSPGTQWTLIKATLNGPGEICEISRFSPCGTDFYATPISTYGVIGFWKFRNPGSPNPSFAEYWIYKPSAVGGDVIPPTVSITAPANGATVSGASVTLSATASDAVGVVGVQFKIDGVATGTEDTTSPYSITWNSTAVGNGSHAITATARDAAGNSTTSAAVNVTVSNAGSGSNFTTRCAAAGVIMCESFDTTASFAKGDGAEGPKGINILGTTAPTIDTVVKASGTGALKLTVPANSGANSSGNFWRNFSDDYSIQFSGNSDFYVQFRWRATSCFLKQGSAEPCTGPPRAFLDAGGWKVAHIGTGDHVGCGPSNSAPCFSSCSSLETVPQNSFHRGFAQIYHSCPGPQSQNDEVLFNGSDFKLQSARTTPFCLYSQAGAGTQFPPTGNCFAFFPDEWMTFKIRITTGNRISSGGNDFFQNSTVRMWIAREGQASELVSLWNLTMYAGPTSEAQNFGKVYLNNYNTGKNPAETNPVSAVWYDELIVSTQDIADPSAVTDTIIPTVAITSPIPPTTSSTTSPIAVSGTATDNIGVTSVTWTCVQCTIKGGTATSSPGTSISWLIPALNLVSGTNVVNVVAHDAAGNVSTAATLTITYSPRPTRYIDGNLVSNCTANYSIGNRTCTGTDGDAYTTANAGTATAATVAGDTLFVRSGTYNLRIDTRTLTINSGTGDTTRVKIAGYPGETVTLFPLSQTGISCLGVNGKQYVWFDNFICDGTNVTASESTVTADETSSFIRFSYIEAKNNGPVGSDPAFSGAGFLIGGNAQELQHVYAHDNGLNGAACGTAAPYGAYFSAHNSTIENSRFIHNGTYGVHQYHSNSSSTNGNIIRYNEIADNGAARSCGHGLLVSSGSGHQIYGNVIRDQGNGGANVSFDHSQPCVSCEFYNNTVVRGTYGAYIEVNSTGVLAKNNIFMNNATANVINLPGGSTTFAQNLCFGTGGTTGCAITTSDPLFVNYAADDFRLNTGSPALNVGVPLAIVTNSIDGTPRPQGALLDLGAYESSTASLPVVTIVNPTANASLGVSSPIFSLGGTSTLP